MTDSSVSVVIDNGSRNIKAGFSRDTAPRSIFPSISSRWQPRNSAMVGMGGRDSYVGDEAVQKRRMLQLLYPIQYGMIVDWEHMERIWHHMFYNELRIAPEEHAVLLADKIANAPKSHRQKITQIMFETFNVPMFYLMHQSELALHSTGMTSAIVIDCGYQTTYSVPIHDGYILKQGVAFSEIGGQTVTEYLQKEILSTRHTADLQPCRDEFEQTETVNHLKEKHGFVSNFGHLSNEIYAERLVVGYVRSQTVFDFNATEIPSDIVALCDAYDDGTECKLPDGNVMQLSRYERVQGLSCMFGAELLKEVDSKRMAETPLHRLCWNSMSRLKDMQIVSDGSDVDVKSSVAGNIVLFGGNSMFVGLRERFEKEMKELLQESSDSLCGNIKVTMGEKAKEAVYCVWTGGSMLSCIDSFMELWIDKDEYDESGPSIIHRRGL